MSPVAVLTPSCSPLTLRTTPPACLDPVLESVAAARALVRTRCSAVADSVRDAAVLLTSEVVTNAVRYAGGEIDIEVLAGPTSVVVRVGDGGDDLPVLREVTDLCEGGRGLQLVEALAARWGVEPRHHGKVVWFAVDAVSAA